MWYPSDYGYFPDTLGEDGDPLDAIVLLWEPVFHEWLLEVETVAVFKMRDEKGIDHKVLCRPVNEPMWAHIQTLADVPPHLLKEIEHFSTVYRDLEKEDRNRRLGGSTRSRTGDQRGAGSLLRQLRQPKLTERTQQYESETV